MTITHLRAADALKYAAAILRERANWTTDAIYGSECTIDHDTDAVRIATDEYQHDSDAVARFIADKCHIGPMFRATTSALYEAWQRWQESDACDPIGRGAFGNALDSRGYPAAKPAHGKRWRSGIGLSDGVPADED